ncbi:MAG: hypothetical protein E7293_03735 [Lachnospiraceae bacterium]|nr:hypothetical protein [Lachnospiraceae bacterium]
MKYRRWVLLSALLYLLFSFPSYSYASGNSGTYTYNVNRDAVPSAQAYRVSLVVDEEIMGCAGLSSPQDIFVDSKDITYILDSGNARVVILDKNFKCIKEIREFSYQGEILTLAKGAEGIFFRESNASLYIADTENNRIIVADLDGNVSHIYEKPVGELLDPTVAYKPQKIVVDNMGIMYVTSGNVNTGALMIDSNNEFKGFYGANSVSATWEVIVEYMWRSIMTKEQRAQSEYSFQPTEFNNIFWSEDRFIYAVSPISATIESPVVKLNAVGNNVLNETEFGDMKSNSWTVNSNAIFSDITADEDNVFTILDTTSGKLYQYDEECNLLTIFGGIGYQNGLFVMPVSVETNSTHDILVLDASKNTITVMEQTYYGEMIRKAVFLHNEGLYVEAVEPWEEVIRMNPNYYLAYKGMGKAYVAFGDYKTAMRYFELGMDKVGYSDAKGKLRNEIIKENFTLIVVCVVGALILIMGFDSIKKILKKIKTKERKSRK